MNRDPFLWRRHVKNCPLKGRNETDCKCPVWRDGYVDGKRIRASMGTTDWDRAERKLGRLTDPEYTPPIKIPGAVAEYLEDCRARGLRKSTLRSYEKTFEHFQDFCARHQFTSMGQLNLESMTSWRQERKILASTQRKEIEALRAFFAFAIERQWVEKNWAKKLRPPLEHGVPTLPYEQNEIDRILAACDELGNRVASWSTRARKRARGLVLLLLYSGLRISDAASLERKALDRNTGKLLLRRQQKTGTPVYVRLPDSVIGALDAMPVESKRFFFWNETSLVTTLIGNMRRTIQYVLKKAAVKGHPHRFRDTFAVRLLEGDTPIRTVQILLGHNSVRTTERHYAPFVQSQQRLLDAAVAKLDFGEEKCDIRTENRKRG